MKRLFLVGTAALSVVVVFTLVFGKEKKVDIPFNPTTYDAFEDREYWIGQIKKLGAESAYNKFVEENNKIPPGAQHIRAHVIGEALFETEEVGGIAICDASFGFGCFHGLFTIGFASQGRAFIQESDTLCLERYGPLGTGCQHGIGHGIVEYAGHDNLNEALALCEETSQPTPLLGCTSGVFMEHNTPFTVLPDQDVLEPYPYSDEAPYGACEGVPEKYKQSCYYELGGYWEVVLKGDKFKMGELCSKIQSKVYRDSCALGVGNIIGPTNQYEVEESHRACSLTPERIVTLCHAGAAWSMFSNPAHQEKARFLCKKLKGTEQDTCMLSYDLTQSYSF